MKVWKGFIRRNKGWLGLFTGMTASHLFYLYLMRAPKADLVYSTCIDVGIFLVIFLVMWITYQKKVQRLRQFLSCPLENNMQLPEAEEFLEELYTELFSRANEERAEAMRRAGRDKQEQREYYARWVHQIKTPIAAMQLLLQTQREEAPERYKEQEEIEEQLFRIQQYVSMALQYQRKDSHDYVLHAIALDGIIRDSIHKYAKMMIRKKIGIQYEGCDLVVTSDEKWLSFVVEQLLSNAVKYMQEGVITIQTGQNETEAFLCIEDQGIGIRQEDIPRVFEQGYTGFNGHTDKHSTGIGLYLCKQVLTKLGHTIRITSEPGKGTQVWIGFSLQKIDIRD